MAKTPVAFCFYHKKYLYAKEAEKKKCGLEKMKNGELKFTGVCCPHLVQLNSSYWEGYNKNRQERKISKKKKKFIRKVIKHRRDLIE